MLFATCWSIIVCHSPFCCVLLVVHRLMFAVWCVLLLFVVCCLLLIVACCLLMRVCCCALCIVCCVPFVVGCCVLCIVSCVLLFVVGCCCVVFIGSGFSAIASCSIAGVPCFLFRSHCLLLFGCASCVFMLCVVRRLLFVVV